MIDRYKRRLVSRSQCFLSFTVAFCSKRQFQLTISYATVIVFVWDLIGFLLFVLSRQCAHLKVETSCTNWNCLYLSYTHCSPLFDRLQVLTTCHICCFCLGQNNCIASWIMNNKLFKFSPWPTTVHLSSVFCGCEHSILYLSHHSPALNDKYVQQQWVCPWPSKDRGQTTRCLYLSLRGFVKSTDLSTV